ncbi:MAG: SDR family oxidoreductase [Candidatus Woesearchaeota archaeon]
MTKVWFITGCSSGFGLELVKQLSEKGEYVVATARKPELIPKHQNILPLQLDVTNNIQIKETIKNALEWKGKIDILINNAGFGSIGSIEGTPVEVYRSMFETNVFGLLNVTKEFLPHFRAKKSGTIVNISSIAGIRSTPGLGPYCSSKFAVEAISEALYNEVEPFNIKVMIVEPGPFRTKFSGNLDVSEDIPDYDEVTSRVKSFVLDISTNGKGNPTKAASAIIQAASMDNPPLRLPLGNWAVDGIIEKGILLTKQAVENEKLSRETDD